ncbi:metal-sensing transcriptional repressor [Gluconobacter japonicus]|uniref:metal-sensing transcriptional repressor n=1 Tax=Gluconobacter japonicus TaxID=376620 RepID=UPI0024ADC3E4|nr:metal-sensing transcriptional repressor [Gluconobacter japonicus]MDI6652912.1 metal-sensing transcriptional repressor [Gluconobacter japonicus]
MKHKTHVQSLKQAHGHLAKILEMMTEERPCGELVQQIQAVESTIHNAKRRLIQDHLEYCIVDEVANGNMCREAAIREFSALAKYL